MSRFLNWLVEPRRDVTDPEDRLRARMLAGFLFSVLTIGVLILFLPPVLEPGAYRWLDTETQIGAAALAAVAIAYVVSRTRRFELAAFVCSAALSIAVLAASYPETGDASEVQLLVYLVVPILISGVALSTRQMTAFMTSVSLALAGFVLGLPPEVRLEAANGILYVSLMVVLGVIITRHRNRVEALRRRLLAESEAHFRAIVQSQPSLIAQVSPEGEVLFVNGAVCDFFGVDECGSLLGKNVSALVPAAAVDTFMSFVCQAAPGDVAQIEVEIAGSWVRWVACVMRRNGDSLVLLVGHDITEHKQVTGALYEANELAIQVMGFRSGVNAALDTEIR